MAFVTPLMSTRGTICKSGTSVQNHLLYTHMSNHYRRIYNAKCSVDTSPPKIQKHNHCKRHWPHSTSQLGQCCPTTCELNIADIANDRKQSEHTSTRNAWMEHQVFSQARGATPSQHRSYMHSCQQGKAQNRPLSHKVTKGITAQDIIDKHAQCFISPNQSFQPRILKSEAHSRLRDLKVYYPPYRRNSSFSCKVIQDVEEEALMGKFSDSCGMQNTVSSKESSCDSAYNDATSSGPDTPEQPSPVTLCPIVCDNDLPSQIMPKRKFSVETSQLNKREEAAYIKFVHDITEDVLAQGIYSNRGLKLLFEYHIANNKGHLNLDRMRDEVSRLCEQLSIPVIDELTNSCEGELSSIACSRSMESMCEEQISDIYCKKLRGMTCQTSESQMPSGFVYRDKPDQDMYNRNTILQAADRVLEKMDRYNILDTMGKKEIITEAAADLVTFIMNHSTVTVNSVADSTRRGL